MKELLKDLLRLRKEYKSKLVTCIKPTDSVSSVMQPTSGIICYDFASLYPRTVMLPFVDKNFLRKAKIKKILQTI